MKAYNKAQKAKDEKEMNRLRKDYDKKYAGEIVKKVQHLGGALVKFLQVMPFEMFGHPMKDVFNITVIFRQISKFGYPPGNICFKKIHSAIFKRKSSQK